MDSADFFEHFRISINSILLNKYIILFTVISVFQCDYAEETPVSDDSCRKSFFEEPKYGQHYELFSVKGRTPKVYFHQNRCIDSVCSTKSRYQTKQYLLRGDAVTAAQEEDGFVCSLYISSEGKSTAGWLEKSSLRASAESEKKSIQPVRWTEEWKSVRSDKKLRISLSRNAEALSFSGIDNSIQAVKETAAWHKIIPVPSKNTADLSIDLCSIQVIYLKNYLAVLADRACAETVSKFSGIYSIYGAFAKKNIPSVHEERKDPDFFRFYSRLLKAVKNKDNKSLISFFSDNIKCSLGEDEGRKACIAEFHLGGSEGRPSPGKDFWEELEVILESGGKNLDKKTFYFPSADYADRSNMNFIDYSLILGENIPVYKKRGKYILKRISNEFVKIIDSDKSEWSRIQTADGKEGFVNKNFLRVLDGSDKRLIIEKINGKWVVAAYIGGI